VYRKKSRYDQAVNNFTKAIEVNPADAEVYYNRGNAYYNKSQYRKAISDYTKAIELNPNYSKAYYNRGLAFYHTDQYELAINEFSRAIKINPNYAEAYDNRGFTYFVKLGNKIKGCADLKKACELGKCRNYNLAKQKGYCS